MQRDTSGLFSGDPTDANVIPCRGAGTDRRWKLESRDKYPTGERQPVSQIHQVSPVSCCSTR